MCGFESVTHILFYKINYKMFLLFLTSDTANRHRLRSLARIGSGCFEFFDSKLKSKWGAKVCTGVFEGTLEKS